MPGAENTEVQPGAEYKLIDGTESQNPAGQSGDQGTENNGADELANFSDPKKALEEIKKLRKENATHRTKNRDLEGQLTSFKGTMDKLKAAFGGEGSEEISPEEMIHGLQEENGAMAVNSSITQLAWEHGIPFEQGKYFKFLLTEKFEELSDGEELSDEDLEEIIVKVKGAGGTQAAKSTGVTSSKEPPASKGGDDLSVQKFSKMSVGEKSLLYTKDPATYSRLFGLATEQGLL